jgi:hypothetical protein
MAGQIQTPVQKKKKKKSEIKDPCLAHVLTRKAYSLSPLIAILAMGFSYFTFIQFNKFPSYLSFVIVFIMKGC